MLTLSEFGVDRTCYLQPLALWREHDRRHRSGLISTGVAEVFAVIGPGKEPLVGGHWIVKPVIATCNRNKVNRLAARFERDRLRRTAIVLQSQRVQIQRETVVNARAAEAAAIVVRDVVAVVANSRTIAAAGAVREDRAVGDGLANVRSYICAVPRSSASFAEKVLLVTSSSARGVEDTAADDSSHFQ